MSTEDPVDGTARNGRLIAQIAGFVATALLLYAQLSGPLGAPRPEPLVYARNAPLHMISVGKLQAVHHWIDDAHPWHIQHGKEKYPDHAWSQRDAYQAKMSAHLYWIAERLDLHYSLPFLVFEEAARTHWVGPTRQSELFTSPEVHQLRTE